MLCIKDLSNFNYMLSKPSLHGRGKMTLKTSFFFFFKHTEISPNNKVKASRVIVLHEAELYLFLFLLRCFSA